VQVGQWEGRLQNLQGGEGGVGDMVRFERVLLRCSMVSGVVSFGGC
jgi:hypothetical protein